MLAFFLGLFRLVWLFEKGDAAILLENLVLRQQLSIYNRKQKHPRLTAHDLWFWIALAAVWKDWRKALVLVRPDAVIRWQGERFRRYWASLSKRPSKLGRPPITFEIWTLIRTLAQANPLWRAPRIHGELQKLGITVSERTVSRVLRPL